jgi:hypothetical protein
MHTLGLCDPRAAPAPPDLALTLAPSTLQAAVEQRTGMIVEQQRLIFGGRELDGTKSLEELNVHPKEAGLLPPIIPLLPPELPPPLTCLSHTKPTCALTLRCRRCCTYSPNKRMCVENGPPLVRAPVDAAATKRCPLPQHAVHACQASATPCAGKTPSHHTLYGERTPRGDVRQDVWLVADGDCSGRVHTPWKTRRGMWSTR